MQRFRMQTVFLVVALLLVGLISSAALAEETPISLGKRYFYGAKQPSSTYPDPGNQKLTDGQVGTNSYANPNWVGIWDVQPIIIILDLGESMPISKVRIHQLAGTAGIHWPTSISLSVSKDSATWTDPVEIVNENTLPSEPVTQWFTFDNLNLEGRFVQLTLVPRKEGANIFFSEVEVY